MGKITKPVIDLEGLPQEPSWYLVATNYNNEESFEKNLKLGLKVMGLEEYIVETFIPIKHVKTVMSALKNVELTEEDKDNLEKIKTLRNYVFVKAIMTEKVWDYVRTTKGAVTIIAPNGIPSYTPEEKIESLKYQVCADATCEEDILKRFNKIKTDTDVAEEK